MAHDLGRIVGLAAIALVFARLGRVLNAPFEGPDWRLVGVTAAVVGGLVTWAAVSYKLAPLRHVALQFACLSLLVLRVSAGPTLSFGFVPGPDTSALLSTELSHAIELLRFGAPPVLAVAGLTSLVAVGTWILGALWAAGAVAERPSLGIAPPLGFYLYVSVMDRAETGLVWMVALALLAGMGLIATHVVTGPGTGRFRDAENRVVPRRQPAASVVMVSVVALAALGGTTALAGAIPDSGQIAWRAGGGLGPGLGSGGQSLNLFIGLRQDLVSQGDQPVFVARIASDSEDAHGLYWKLITLDTYDGSNWRPGNLGFHPPGRWENPDLTYRGPTARVDQLIRIESLRQDFLPALYSPVEVASSSELVSSGLEVRDDGSLKVAGRTFEGLTYQVVSEVPQTDIDSLAMAGDQLSPIFEEAASEGQYQRPTIAAENLPAERPDILADYLALPDDLNPSIERLANQVTATATTAFERSLLLEAFFRDDDRFTYSTSVETGHSALDMAAWLTDDTSPNYRTGYCEQFATTMAVMGRMVGLPTRAVIGFTPGEPLPQADGSELIVVRQRNAHAWVEVWLDNEGWVRFDPTPRGDGANPSTVASIGFDPSAFTPPAPVFGSPEFNLGDSPSFEDLAPLPGPGLEPGASGPLPNREIGWLLAALAVVVLGAGALPTAKALRRRRRWRRVQEGDITAAWAEIVDRLSDLGVPPARGDTPLEFASARGVAVIPLAHAYSAAVYGDSLLPDATLHFERAEKWLRYSYGSSQRARAAFSLRSLTRR
ncbi:hypothetical protein BH23ACT5_BH23ACT5_11620 [soil metagenome]